jgi:hypothetical protein
VAIPCDACGQPVHEQAVRCPHCGDYTGVPVDPVAAAEVELIPAVLARPRADELPLDGVASALVDVVSHAIGAAAELVKPDRPDDDPLPRATARHRRPDS